MREIKVNRAIDAPRQAVWSVLADFPNIADWNSGVKESHATGDAAGGIGATRHCDLAPIGELEETIAEWEPDQKLVVRIDSAKKLPIASGLVTFSLDGDDADGPTPTGIHYSYDPKGLIGKLMGPMIDRQLTKGFGGFLEDLEAEAKERASA